MEEKEINSVESYIRELMVPIPEGMESIRRYRDEKKWISSDSKMSIPGSKGNMKEEKEEVVIAPFLLAKYPVTQELYDCVMGEETHGGSDPVQGQMPVVMISWYDAIQFCNMLSKALGLEVCYSFADEGTVVSCDWRADGFRLPTDAEWQYACRGKSKGYRYGALEDIAWYKENAEGRRHKVGEKAPNQWGLYDMLGNVWEWCWDLYDEEKYGSYRIFRGGSWAEEARGCGTTCRRRSHPSFGIEDLGFRLARRIEEPEK